ncbi:MAG: glycosyltransferase family 2 protein, partial [Bacillaceae bacterium]
MIKVSVIIPVYNAEVYLEECIQSLLKQTINECEFIFVNDGSTDNSLSILKRYKEIDERI